MKFLLGLILFVTNHRLGKPKWVLIETEDTDGKEEVATGNMILDAGNMKLEEAIDQMKDANNGDYQLIPAKMIESIIGKSSKTKLESWNWLKKEVQVFNFLPLITNLVKLANKVDINKIIEGINIEQLVKANNTKKIDSKILISKLQRIAQEIGVRGVNIPQIMEELNFNNIITELNNGGTNLAEALRRIDIKKSIAGINVNEFSRNLGKTIAALMKHLDGTIPKSNVLKEIMELKKMSIQIINGTNFNAIDVFKIIEGLNLDSFSLISGVDLNKLMEIVREGINSFDLLKQFLKI